MANNEVDKEYDALVAKTKHAFTHDGDAALSPQFGTAVIHAVARGTSPNEAELIAAAQKQAKEDADAIALWIIDTPPTLITQNAQEIVKANYELSQLSDEELAAQELTRDGVTADLDYANKHYQSEQKAELAGLRAVMSYT